MTLIINDLYLGGISDVNDSFIYDNKIKTIITVAKELYITGDHAYFEWFYFPLDDNNVPVMNEMMNIASIIEKQLEKGAVLIHCYAGYSRSPTMVIAYLMIKHGHNVLSAYNFIVNQRPILPNPYFMDQLMVLEENISHTRSFQPYRVDSDVIYILCSLSLPSKYYIVVESIYLSNNRDIWTTCAIINRRNSVHTELIKRSKI